MWGEWEAFALADALAQAAPTGPPSLREVLTILASIVVAVLSLAGVMYTARSARGANTRQQAIEKQKADTDDYVKRVESYQRDLDRMQSQRDSDHAYYKSQLDEVRERLEDVETRSEQTLREWIQWARGVIAILRDRGISYPAPPTSVTDSGGHRKVE